MPDMMSSIQTSIPDLSSKNNKRISGTLNGREINTPEIVEKADQVMGKDSFLELLVTQLKYQDPMKPMEDREFISQMAQFSALEQMQNMANGMNTLKTFQAGSLIGKMISGSDADTGKLTSGTVDKILYNDKTGEVTIIADKHRIKLKNILSIEDVPVEKTDLNENQPGSKNVSRETISGTSAGTVGIITGERGSSRSIESFSTTNRNAMIQYETNQQTTQQKITRGEIEL